MQIDYSHKHLPKYMSPNPPYPMLFPSLHLFCVISVRISPAGSCAGNLQPAAATLFIGTSSTRLGAILSLLNHSHVYEFPTYLTK